MYFSISFAILLLAMESSSQSLPSKIHLGYGTTFENEGNFVSGVGTYDVFMQVPLLNISKTLPNVNSVFLQDKCRIAHLQGTDAHILCQYFWPFYLNFQHLIFQKQKEIYTLLTEDLKLILPGVSVELNKPEQPVSAVQLEWLNFEPAQEHMLELALELRKRNIKSKKINFGDLMEEATDSGHKIPQGSVRRNLKLGLQVKAERLEIPLLWKRIAPKVIYDHIPLVKAEETSMKAMIQTALKMIQTPRNLKENEKTLFALNYRQLIAKTNRTITPLLRQRDTCQIFLEQLRKTELYSDQYNETLAEIGTLSQEVIKVWTMTVLRQRRIQIVRFRNSSSSISRILRTAEGEILSHIRSLQRTRSKRFLPLVNFAWHIANLFGPSKRKLAKAVNKLNSAVIRNSEHLVTIENDLMAVTKLTTEHFEIMNTDIHNLAESVQTTIDEQFQLASFEQFDSREIVELHNAIRYVVDVVTTLVPTVDEQLEKYDQLVLEIQNLFQDLVSLRDGKLSPGLLPIRKVRTVLDQVRTDLIQNYRDWTLIPQTPADVYGMTAATFSVDQNQVLIRIPLLIRPFTHTGISLFRVNSVYVPVNPESSQNPQTFTKVHFKTKMVAIGRGVYMTVSEEQLRRCWQNQGTYFCSEAFAIQHSSDHICESAIYFEIGHELIRRICEIKIYHGLTPDPQIVKVGAELLLANVQVPWNINCQNAALIPAEITGLKYTKIATQYLCSCSIWTGKIQLERNVYFCNKNQTQPFSRTYSLNQAVLSFHPELFGKFNPDREILSKIPILLEFRIPETPVDEHSSAVVIHSQDPVDLRREYEAMKKHEKVFRTTAQQNKAHLKDVKTWGKLSLFGVSTVVTIILILVVVGVGLVCFFKRKFQEPLQSILSLPKLPIPDSLRRSLRRSLRNRRAREAASSQGQAASSEIELDCMNE